MLYSRYKTKELKDKAGKVIGHERVRKDDKKIKSDDQPADENSSKKRLSNEDQKQLSKKERKQLKKEEKKKENK